jgi:hypothetical protein
MVDIVCEVVPCSRLEWEGWVWFLQVIAVAFWAFGRGVKDAILVEDVYA